MDASMVLDTELLYMYVLHMCLGIYVVKFRVHYNRVGCQLLNSTFFLNTNSSGFVIADDLVVAQAGEEALKLVS